MKGFWPGLLLIVAVGAGCGSPAKISGPVSFEADPLTPGGKLTFSKEYKGKPVLIYNWATWCGPCHQFRPDLNTLAGEYKSKGIGFLALATDTRSEVLNYERENPHEMDVWLDQHKTVTGLLAVEGLPTIIIVDKAHNEVYRQTGVDQGTADKLREVLNSLGA
jgi:thiol-disulfide isomerase/thioredoxin